MKKSSLLTIPLYFAFILGLSQCQKNVTKDSSDKINKTDQDKVLTWLASKQILNQDLEKFEDLKNNLEISNAYFEEYEKGKKFLIVPISRELKSKWDKQEVSEKVLLLLIEVDGTIQSGKVVIYQSNTKKLENNFFNTFYTKQLPKHEFKLTFTTLEDKFIENNKFKDGKQISTGVVQRNNSETNNACTNWYIVTTTYYSDGSHETVYDYIGTTCDGVCPPEVMCLPGDGGGGTAGESGEESIRTWDWELNNVGRFRVISSETVKANLPNAPSSSNGRILSITHAGEVIVNYVPPYVYTWTRSNVAVNLHTYNNSVTSQVSGVVHCPLVIDEYLAEFRARSFSSLWP